MKYEDDPTGEDDFIAIKAILFEVLSDTEKVVLEEWLTNNSYKEAAEKLSISQRRMTNILIRIKRKAMKLKEEGKLDHIEGFNRDF